MKDNVLQDTKFNTLDVMELPNAVEFETQTPPYTAEELRLRLERSRHDYLASRVYTTEEVLDDLFEVMPYTDDELVRRAEKGRREIAEGKYYTNEEVIRMMHRSYEKVAV